MRFALSGPVRILIYLENKYTGYSLPTNSYREFYKVGCKL